MPYYFETTGPITVYILENNHLAAQCLLDIFSQDRDVEASVVGDVGFAINDAPGILVMDQHTFLPYAHKLKILCPSAKILLLGQSNCKKALSPHLLHEIAGIIPYSEVAKNLIRTVRAIWSDLPRISTNSEPLVSMLSPAYSDLCRKLTKREIAVLELMHRRFSNKEIANVLDITEATVKFHVSNIFVKSNVSRRRELFSFFREIGDKQMESLGDQWESAS